ncbi:MAG: suppressor of fused domain protein [Candidatus Eisenbacteria bacterium]|uniref:Suppressor of fused domain protein n=1 Tax=Eiseniibacteriota bacterium TaxID=2212470 RepID=A0A956M3Z9_UNCEI|nr:suppressor of fused domain protein [Candidatus Eisenbacteria bacterium]
MGLAVSPGECRGFVGRLDLPEGVLLQHMDEPRFQAVFDHVRRRVGRVEHVFHWPGSPSLVHVDVLHVAPSRRRPFHTLVTCGMSQRPMCPPAAASDCRLAELYLCLPPEWPIGYGVREEEDVWPIRELSELAFLPHVAETWLWSHHTVRPPDAMERITPGLDFGGWVIGPHIGWRHRDAVLRWEGEDIRFWAALPAYASELAFARSEGTTSLIDLYEIAGVTEIVDELRPNLCPVGTA